jgi:uncharacterized protein (DUF1786 family)
MKILAVDIGTGTQDILLFDTRLHVENSYKLVAPSPTMIVSQRIKDATRRGMPILLSGTIMGGGPSHWAAEAHLKAGLPLYATPQAARSFNDDLDVVTKMGIQIAGDDEIDRLTRKAEAIEMRDFDFPAIARALAQFNVSLSDLSAVAVAVFDHGNAPPGYSDRQFRFDYLLEQLNMEPRLSAFAFLAQDTPPLMTRMLAVAQSAAKIDAPMLVMDTAPAAVLGATFDPQVAAPKKLLIANVGNFHTLAFRLRSNNIEGVFEHHTGLVDTAKLDHLLRALADGSLKHEDVFNDQGHGAIVLSNDILALDKGEFGVAVTGPRQSMMKVSSLRPYFAAPFGDMMLSGCYGLLAAAAEKLPQFKGEIMQALNNDEGRPPWEVK